MLTVDIHQQSFSIPRTIELSVFKIHQAIQCSSIKMASEITVQGSLICRMIFFTIGKDSMMGSCKGICQIVNHSSGPKPPQNSVTTFGQQNALKYFMLVNKTVATNPIPYIPCQVCQRIKINGRKFPAQKASL